ncbi:MAG: histidinol dehydrogenase [Bacteroidota bacterium]
MKKVLNPKKESWQELLQRPTQSIADIEATVDQIFSEIVTKGDVALRKYTQLFDGVFLDNIEVSESEIKQARKQIEPELIEAIELAKSNIEAFHKAQINTMEPMETSPGVICWQEYRPIEKVGLYIPGGSAPLFSTILMLAIPATIAGCKEIVLCTPPDKNGDIDATVLFTAWLCGITKIYKVGGIQAIGAMTFGTDSIPKVYKIFGPGNQFVTVAKQIATKHGVAIDMPAGPSELLVFADQTANASFVAADLLSQAEHGADSQVILVTTSEEMLHKVEYQIKEQIKALPRRKIAEKAIQNSRLLLVSSEEIALDLINSYGPEHLIVSCSSEDAFIKEVNNAGSIFIGSFTPESAGDYASGTNHTLPTNGFAKQYSGVNLYSFQKAISFQKISKQGIKNIGQAIELMAGAEGLQAHKNAVTLRLKSLE